MKNLHFLKLKSIFLYFFDNTLLKYSFGLMMVSVCQQSIIEALSTVSILNDCQVIRKYLYTAFLNVGHKSKFILSESPELTYEFEMRIELNEVIEKVQLNMIFRRIKTNFNQ